MFRVVIPARHASQRLPGKPLMTLAGKPMLQWVHERARRSAAKDVVVATDDQRIRAAAVSFGADVQMTDAAHPSGTDRIAEVARLRDWSQTDVIVNVQGDEPLMQPRLVDQVAQLLLDAPSADMATLCGPLTGAEAYADANVVKVVADARGRALYFSRAPIPCDRDAATGTLPTAARRHIGIYAYRVSALVRLASLQPGPLETLERLEQLRALENGMTILVADAVVPPGPDVNTAEDLARAEAALLQ
ncbi:MAG: 3-deoxy-manno-octulosonate cytidylyltransferase [Steroidobacteraceae bacterium]